MTDNLSEPKEEQKNPELEEKNKEIQTLKDQILRLQADFENMRKRSLKIQVELQETANSNLLQQLLEIYDDFERAASPASASDAKTFQKGIEMIAKRLETFLKSYGVTPIDAVGQQFDPSKHEAVAHEATEEFPESTVLEELRKGYIMNGRVLRTSVVKVAVKPEGPGPGERMSCEKEPT